MTEVQSAVAADHLEIYGTDGDDHLVVPANDDWNHVEAYTGSDLIEVDQGNTGHVNIWLGDGGDTVHGGPGSESLRLWDEARIGDTRFHGGAGDDYAAIYRGAGPDIFFDGGDGKDILSLGGRGVFVHLENGTALIGLMDEPGVFVEATVLNFEDAYGSSGHDILVGTDRGSRLAGYGGDDLLSGRGGTDRLEGSDGDDILVGGRGADGLLSGRGADIIRIDRLVESLPGQEDTILDFTFRDTIDLSRIDADPAAPDDQAFAFIGAAAFSGTAGELRYEAMGADLLVSADANGDRVADLAVKVRDLTQLAASDFIL
ncbi:calcium-binding protein [Inquilinus sp. Marseille-Q2685]|uniref:calcium-binding protein n=1 Tax=Inquilinus sp. Marseille-Q2685 TaxID=2866581 RepID=UPI001CE4087B|nr:M10 family metallopeptidase C-terminal domain-containing protein [Inquilinus sp. Marseille-Q2685]